MQKTQLHCGGTGIKISLTTPKSVQTALNWQVVVHHEVDGIFVNHLS